MRVFILDDAREKSGEVITVTSPRVVRHAHVIRLQQGEEVAIQIVEDSHKVSHDSQTVVRYIGVVEEMNRKQLTVKVTSRKQQLASKKRQVAMAVSLPNTGAKLDMIVEKLTEVGVDKIVFFPAERSQMRDLSEKKLAKLTLYALEASEQSNRWMIPEVDYVRNLDDVLVMKGEKVIFDKSEKAKKAEKREKAENVMGLVGPEGGWSDRERKQMQSFRHLYLGDTILRIETAAIMGGYELVRTGIM